MEKRTLGFLVPLSLIACLSISTTGCQSPAVESLCAIPPGATPAQTKQAICRCFGGAEQMSLDGVYQRKVDVLIVVDNTPSMAKKQRALVDSLARLPSLMPDLDYHIGVVTTDVGSWPAPGQSFATPFPGCDSFSGDDGRLQAISCWERMGLSADAAATCATECPDRRFVPTDGQLFLKMKKGIANVPSAPVVDARTGARGDLGPEFALRCMATVGDTGCQLSSPFEAMKRALTNPSNQGFLRADSSLAVIIATDKDDCSVQQEQRQKNDPKTRDCPVADGNAPMDCFSPEFRCLAGTLRCSEPMNTVGTKSGCQARSDSYLESVESYVDFLRTIKTPSRLFVVGLWPEPNVSVAGEINVTQQLGTTGTAGLTVSTAASAVCQNTAKPEVFGQPQIRLSKFITAVYGTPKYPLFQEGSICLPDNIDDTLNANFGVRAGRRPGPAILWHPPIRRSDGSAACLVGDVPENNYVAAPEKPLPTCQPSCCTKLMPDALTNRHFSAETVAVCQGEASDCYCIGPNQWYGADSDQTEVQVWRHNNGDPPPGTVLSIHCGFSDLVCTGSL